MRHLFDLWGESCKKVKWPHTLYKYACKVLLSFSEWFWRYRWNELSVTYLHTNILHTDQPSHWISICWLETWPIGMAIPVKKLQNWRVYNVHYYIISFLLLTLKPSEHPGCILEWQLYITSDIKNSWNNLKLAFLWMRIGSSQAVVDILEMTARC